MKNVLFFIIGFIITIPVAFTQPITVSFKPNANDGEDATILEFHDNFGRNCTPDKSSQPVSDLNFGSNSEVNFGAWTYNLVGCPLGTARELIRFTQLNSIPSDAFIISATLILQGPNPTVSWGNNLFPGSPVPNDNSGWVKRVLPGSADAWSEGGVTWNSQPNTDPADWAFIPPTNLRWGWTQNIDVTTIVTNIVNGLQTDPDANNGFMLTLQDETFYRQQCYASSDHSDPSLWPELRVTYRECSSGFSYCVPSDQPSTYNFNASDPNLLGYEWMVDWNSVGNGPSLNYDFMYNSSSSGSSHTVCLTAENINGDKCQRCLQVCGSNNIKIGNKDNNGNVICNPVFTYCTSTPNNENYTFTAQDQTLPFYNWLINGTVVGTGPTLSYSFPSIGDYQIELHAGNSSTYYCFSLIKNFCVSPVYLYGEGAKSGKLISEKKPQTSKMIQEDDPTLFLDVPEQVIISPNPTENGWNVICSLKESDKITINLFDLSGRQIKKMIVKGNKGFNQYYMPASELASGLYFIETKSKELNNKQKAVKQ